MDDTQFDIYIETDGTVRHVYDDVLAGLCGDDLVTRRASHVEPVRGGWVADMSPVGGPVLLAEYGTDPIAPFLTRADALAAEREWLDRQVAAGQIRGGAK